MLLFIETHNFNRLYKPAMTVQYRKAEIFQVGKRNRTNQKMMDNWGNANIA
jgi:hypothetical protein